ncbi:MAG TPA: ribosomal protein S18-alanine N-acetyltransferase [Gemmatimonadaceae bacterium]|nr:ribosomal protein S18-alanine N-acetyltransferase [Gemmatimonadaceae bacterium]
MRVATAADLDAIHAIEVASFATPWSRASFRDVMMSDAARLVVATDATGAVVGFAVVVAAADEAELANLAVAPAARRSGVARNLVEHVLAAAEAGGARDVFLEVRESNAAARALYAAFGFAEVGRRRAYYQAPDEDALVLRRSARAAMR